MSTILVNIVLRRLSHRRVDSKHKLRIYLRLAFKFSLPASWLLLMLLCLSDLFRGLIELTLGLASLKTGIFRLYNWCFVFGFIILKFLFLSVSELDEMYLLDAAVDLIALVLTFLDISKPNFRLETLFLGYLSLILFAFRMRHVSVLHKCTLPL